MRMYFGLRQTSMMKLFSENNLGLEAVKAVKKLHHR